jgi:hypothetical protein
MTGYPEVMRKMGFSNNAGQKSASRRSAPCRHSGTTSPRSPFLDSFHLADKLGAVGWSRDGNYVYYDTLSDRSTFRRVRIGQTRSEVVVDLKDIRRFSLTFVGAWSGVAPDGSSLFVRDLSTDEIYSLDLELP